MVFQLTQKLVFPDPHYGEPDGLLAVTVSSLPIPMAYSLGMLSVKNRYNGGVP